MLKLNARPKTGFIEIRSLFTSGEVLEEGHLKIQSMASEDGQISMGTYGFDISELEVGDCVAYFSSRKRVVHVKGYALGMDPSYWPPKAFFDAIGSSDTIVFDGDDLKNESYTRIVAALGAGLGQCQQPELVAFRAGIQTDQFLRSWGSQRIENDSTGPLVKEIKDIDSSQGVGSIRLRLCTLQDDRLAMEYVELGNVILKLTNSKEVFCIGGGHCVYQEFIKWTDDFGIRTTDADEMHALGRSVESEYSPGFGVRSVNWFVLNVDRNGRHCEMIHNDCQNQSLMYWCDKCNDWSQRLPCDTIPLNLT